MERAGDRESTGRKHRTGVLTFRPYQFEAFQSEAGIEIWLWGRQTGKSFTLAAWAVDRLIKHPGRLVTVLSNSRANGMELNLKCAEVCRMLTDVFDQQDLSTDERFETMNYETRITMDGRVGRIKVLAANPRTARGFSGDLILDEFAFHEDSAAIWEAAEPILSAHPDYQCRIASTPNGRRNKFYQMVTDGKFPVRTVPRSLAHAQGLKIYHPVTRAAITPEEARELASDKRAYDQNYECVFESENMALLTMELISAAEEPGCGVICDGEWSAEAKEILSAKCEVRSANGEEKSYTEGTEKHGGHRESRESVKDEVRSANGEEGKGRESGKDEVRSANGEEKSYTGGTEKRGGHRESRESAKYEAPYLKRNFYIGVDVGRNQDLTVITVLEKTNDLSYVRAMLRLRNMRLPEQQAMLEVACRSPRFAGAEIDMTGIGLGLYEYTHKVFGDRIRGINFASNLSLSNYEVGSANVEVKTAKAPEVLALRLLQIYEARRLRHPVDPQLREDLRQPERVTTAEGRVSIVSSRGEAGHADHFWSLALAVDASQRQPEPYIYVPRGIRPRPLLGINRKKLICIRHGNCVCSEN